MYKLFKFFSKTGKYPKYFYFRYLFWHLLFTVACFIPYAFFGVSKKICGLFCVLQYLLPFDELIFRKDIKSLSDKKDDL